MLATAPWRITTRACLLLVCLGGSSARASPPAKQAGPAIVHIEKSTPTHMYRTGFEAISKQLAALGHKGDRVLLRSFSASRLPQMLATGTDRDNHSGSWSVRAWDSDDASRLAAHMSPAKITYGIDMIIPKSLARGDWTKFPSVVKTSSDPGQMFDVLRSGRSAIAVYDRSVVARADSGGRRRAAKVEFWFKRAPKSGLLMVLTPTDKAPAPIAAPIATTP